MTPKSRFFFEQRDYTSVKMKGVRISSENSSKIPISKKERRIGFAPRGVITLCFDVYFYRLVAVILYRPMEPPFG